MKRIDAPLDPAHESVLMLLPWYVNKTLQGAELIAVEQHLTTCSLCKSQLISLQQLSLAVNHASAFNTSPPQSFSKLKERLKTAGCPQMPPAAQIIRPNKWRIPLNVGLSTMRRPALALAASGILLTVVLSRGIDVNQMLNNNFQTLSDTKAVNSNANEIRLIFKENTKRQTIEQVVGSVQGYIVSGPDGQSLYTIGFKKTVNTQQIFDKLSLLRNNESIVFAEPAYGLLSNNQVNGTKP
jgi:hypothetical protein